MNNTHRLFPPEEIQEIREIIDQLSLEAANVHLGIDGAPHPDKAAHACRKLIRAYAKAPNRSNGMTCRTRLHPPSPPSTSRNGFWMFP
ncbi:hypothetical protein [Phyllobacterium zundukense]|uniref:Uncharacterized protein n=1 Tax=Phyllobacterium zundukense TaxID=1867719 RepID=A0A2N9W391_9HYPH|nr:hypothetical protein [Phyllobacterium zundukense]ATU94413.1 hypothetical protein BLM14_22020 [Phyllobacterium zundukense]PIO46209.1 hypothetical protein B5P45_03635 [Phyllobacterium zundukense]